jgi:hypothetical protein
VPDPAPPSSDASSVEVVGGRDAPLAPAPAGATVTAADEPPAPPVRRLHWWKEAILIVAFYGVYSLVRNQFGSARLGPGEEPTHAFNNAMRVIDLEKAIRIYHEVTIQGWFLPYRHFIQFWNTFYGTAHFIVTIVAFVWLFRRRADIFPTWRNALGFITGLAIVGFALFPLMPPRLLNDTGRYGGDRIAQEQHRGDFGFVDTLDVYGGPWNFDSGAGAKVSNQYAAMPSLHIAWSSWCALVMWRLAKRKWVRALLIIYPLATLFCIVVTANHYFLDAVGGLVILVSGIGLGALLNEWNDRRLARRATAGVAALAI